MWPYIPNNIISNYTCASIYDEPRRLYTTCMYILMSNTVTIILGKYYFFYNKLSKNSNEVQNIIDLIINIYCYETYIAILLVDFMIY